VVGYRICHPSIIYPILFMYVFFNEKKKQFSVKFMGKLPNSNYTYIIRENYIE